MVNRAIPPWYDLEKKIRFTYGASPYINVNELVVGENGKYILKINVRKDIIAKALRQIIPISKSNVDIVVFDSNGEEVPVSNEVYTLETLAQLFCNSLIGNPLCVGSVINVPEISTTEGITVIIKKKIVQYHNDNTNDLCGNYNEVAAKVFEEVSNIMYTPNLSVYFSTYDYNSREQKDVYCPCRTYKCKKQTIE